jgi:hypothetical protein
MTNSKSKESAERLQAFLYHWQFLSENVQSALVELVSKHGPTRNAKGFPTPPLAKWSDVEILLMDHDRVRIIVAGISKDFTIAALGLEDKRRGAASISLDKKEADVG